MMVSSHALRSQSPLSADRWPRVGRPLRQAVFALAALGLVTGAAPSGAANVVLEQFPGITFDDGTAGRLVITTRAYRLTLDKRNGKILDIVDRVARARLVHGTKSCLWRAQSRGRPSLKNACSFTPQGIRRFSYQWNPRSATLRLEYRDPVVGSATVMLRARARFFDLGMTIENRGAVLTNVSLPGELLGDVRTVETGYAPNVLPGVRLKPGFFTRVGNNLHIYPSRWAFADYLALEAGRGHLSRLLGQPRPDPPCRARLPAALVSWPLLGTLLLHRPPVPDLDRSARKMDEPCRPRSSRPDRPSSRSSPIGRDNGIDAYPSVQKKLGARLNDTRESAADQGGPRKLKPFRDWDADLPRLPSPALLHPVAFQPGGHDENDPDFLPPDPQWGTNADFASVGRRGAFAGSARDAVPERQLVVRRIADDAIAPFATPTQRYRRPRRGRQAGRQHLRLEVRGGRLALRPRSCAAGWRG